MKVYLSKSNLSDPYLVDMVRQIIQKEGYEVLEYHGGEYSHDLLLTADCLVIVPSSSALGKAPGFQKVIIPPSGFTWGYHIGKGQYEQIKTFWEQRSCCRADYKDKNWMFIDSTIICLEEVGHTEVYAGGCDSIIPVENGDWKVRYAMLEINSRLDNIKGSLKDAETLCKAAGRIPFEVPIPEIHTSSNFVGNSDTFLKPSDFMVNVHRNPSSRVEQRFINKWSSSANKDGVTYHKDCFDGTLHLACRRLFNR